MHQPILKLMAQDNSFNTDRVSRAEQPLRQLTAELGQAAVLTGDDVAGSYVKDWAGDRKGQGLAVLRPGSVAAVSV